MERGVQASQVAAVLTQETEMQVPSLGGEEPLEEGMAAHSSILAWRIPWTEEHGGLQPVESQTRTRLNDPYIHTRTAK